MSDRHDLEGDREAKDLKVALTMPRIKITPIAPPSNKFWDSFGDDKQPGNLKETEGNPYP